MNKLKDIFGKEINPGDIVGYASSRGIFIVVVDNIVYNRLGNPIKLKMTYPKIKSTYSRTEIGRVTNEEIIETKYMRAYQQEFIKISWTQILHYEGRASFRGIDDVAEKVFNLSREIRIREGLEDKIAT